MKKNTFITGLWGILLALLTGLAAGYFIFGGRRAEPPGNEQITTSPAAQSKPVTWTCSMHPQIRQPEPGICPLCEMNLIPLEEGGSESPLQLTMTPEAVRLAGIRTAQVKRMKPSASTMILSGTIAADEQSISAEVAHVPGRLEDLRVSLTGARVVKGQHIATLYAPELITAQRELQEALKLEASHPGLAEAARGKLRNWYISESLIERLQNDPLLAKRFPLYAQYSGEIAELKVAVGDYVATGQALYTLQDLNQVWVTLDAYPDQIGGIQTGDSVKITGPSLSPTGISGKVSFIDPVVDPHSGVATVRVSVANPTGQLRPGVPVQGTLFSQTRTTVPELTIPASAVLWTGTQSVVYVRVPGSEPAVFEYRSITLGDRKGETYVVVDGLEEGEEIVLEGAFRIDAAAQLNNRQSMMNELVEIQGGLLTATWAEDLPEVFREAFTDVIRTYLDLKEALVMTDREVASQRATLLTNALAAMPAGRLSGEAGVYWNRQSEAMKKHSAALRDAKDIEDQRIQFEWISNLLIDMLKTTGMNQGPLFIQHCPMAFGDKGADWLSADPAILNPYFGDVMLRCGLVIDTLSGFK